MHLDQVKLTMENEKIDLMYRRPGNTEHENITDVLDDVLNRLKAIEVLVKEEENIDESPGLTD